MRSIKTCQLGAGLFNLQVKWYKAVDDDDAVKLHQHHGPTCMGAIGYRRYCKQCNQDVEHANIVKGATVQDAEGNDQVIPVGEDDLKNLYGEQPNAEIFEFVASSSIDPMQFAGTYFLDAAKGSEKPYALLLRALAESDRFGIVHYALRERTRTGALRVLSRPDGDVLAVHPLLLDHELRSTAELKGARAQVKLSDAELTMARSFIDAYSGEWDSSKHTDVYTQRLDELIEARRDGAEFVTNKPDEATEPVVSDLLAKLEASITAKQQQSEAA